MAAIGKKVRILEERAPRTWRSKSPREGQFSMAETTKAPKAPAKPRKTAAKAKKTSPETAETIELKPVPVSHDEIRRLAHQYWIDGGHRHGHQHEDWARAEAELRRRAS
jgi:hypothetical protein